VSLSQQKLLARLVEALESADIPYMLTGSHVTSLLGEPRSTHDVDVVVQIQAEDIAKLALAFPSIEFAFDNIAAKEAIARGDQFQVMEFSSGDKVDFWVFRDEPFDRSAFARRYRNTVAGISAFLPAAEDHLIQKLKWAKDYESERQYRDALSVYELQHAKLDMNYLLHWIKQLQLESVWQQLISEAQPLS
jgi:hypothetical protein